MGRLRKNTKYENKLFNDSIYFVKNPALFKGEWNKNVFLNNNPIEIEIGSGKGRFIIENALKFPDKNFIAIDKFPTILYKIISKLKSLQLSNLKIICCDAKELNNIFDYQEVSKIYLNFSDPWPKKNHEKNRLTNIDFLKRYFLILKKNQFIEFKTDNQSLYEYTLEVIKKYQLSLEYYSDNIYNDDQKNKENIQTEYEIKWLAKNAQIKKIIIKNV